MLFAFGCAPQDADNLGAGDLSQNISADDEPPQNATLIIENDAASTNSRNIIIAFGASDMGKADSGVAGYYLIEHPSPSTLSCLNCRV